MTKSVKDIVKIYEEIRTDELFVLYCCIYVIGCRIKFKKEKKKEKKSVKNVEYLFLV